MADDSTRSESVEQRIVALGLELGWSAVGIADIMLEREAVGYQAWLAAGHHGEMEYMVRHGSKRWRPDELQPGTKAVISVALDYWPTRAADAWSTAVQLAQAARSTEATRSDDRLGESQGCSTRLP